MKIKSKSLQLKNIEKELNSKLIKKTTKIVELSFQIFLPQYSTSKRVLLLRPKMQSTMQFFQWYL